MKLIDILKTNADSAKSYIENLLEKKQDALTFDSTPTADSTNPVTSDGIKKAIDAKTVDLSNYPTKDGVGATGTWNIDVTGIATKATQDSNGNNISTTYATKTEVDQKISASLYSIQKIMDIVYPVGSIWETTTDDDPNKKWTGTTWVKMDAGRVLVSAGSYTENGTTYTYNLGDKGGEAKHKSTVDEIAAHTHTGTTSTTGNHSHSGTTAENGDHQHYISNKDYNNNKTYLGNNYLIKKCTSNSYENFELFGSGNGACCGLTSLNGNHNHTFDTNTTGNHSHTFTTSSVGGNAAHENRQPYLVINRWQRTK